MWIDTEDTNFPKERREMNSSNARFVFEKSSPSGVWGYCKTDTGKLVPVCSTWDSGAIYTGTHWRNFKAVIAEYQLTVDEFFQWQFIERTINQ